MPKVKVSHLEKNTFIYEIDVATRWGKWHLEKKYVEFQDLHAQLEAEFNNLPEVELDPFSFPPASSTISSAKMRIRPPSIRKSWRFTYRRLPNARISSIPAATLSFCSWTNIRP